ncbi:uncharacterized protein K02A2.6-like [Spea bombifrons]|uniref:uncharacterized protein K02A2.6-like n=1 Tax=Spea bombifrons TaxID=233779 RepID=UPI00234BFE33|nr:uncharacterized protein K02A2.6-like [Spea bombifrons]
MDLQQRAEMSLTPHGQQTSQSLPVRTDSLKPPPEIRFVGNLEEVWRSFKQRFSLYMKATNTSTLPSDQKVALLLTVAGAEALDIYNSFQLSETDSENYEIVMERFSAYCTPKKNETYERFVFNSRVQLPHETVEEFLTDLKLKSRSCNYGTLQESLIRDRLVIGCYSNKTRERLLRDCDLTLQKAVFICQSAEQSRKQLGVLCKQDSQDVVNDVRKHRPTYSRGLSTRHLSERRQRNKVDIQDAKPRDMSCGKCGKNHEPRNCPAYGQKCRICKKYNHFASQCKQATRLHAVKTYTSDSSDEDIFVDMVKQLPMPAKEWIIEVEAHGTLIPFKVDTGADPNVIPEALWKKLQPRPKLQKQTKVLKAYNGLDIPTVGQCILTLQHNSTVTKHPFVVVPGEKVPLLGLQSIQQLGLLTKLFEITELKHKSIATLLVKYKDVFSGLGKLPIKYKIALKTGATPVIHAPRKVPVALQDKLKKELQRLIKMDVLEQVHEPTEWVHSLVIVAKKDGSLRLCLDPKELNASIKREHYQIPTRNEILGEMAGAQLFTVLDASNGFWQVPLEKGSRRICTFNTPFGRHCFKRLPFGLCSAPEIFHRTIQQLFDGVEGVKVYIDDILIWGTNEAEHNERLEKVLQIAHEKGLKLNQTKCRFLQSEILYLGEIISSSGVKPDPTKVKAIENMPSPVNKKDLQRFLGMVTYLGKFIANLSDKTKHMRGLLVKGVEWHWGKEHEAEFVLLKELLMTAPTLQFFDASLKTKISTDASKDGLGAVLLQNDGTGWRPIAYAARAFTETEYKYAQIEKETLGIAFGCEAFHNFVYGTSFTIETDHKPLITISHKELWKAPPRIQRLLLKLQKYDYTLEFSPGRHLLIADTLSRIWSERTRSPDDGIDNDVDVHINSIVMSGVISPVMWKKLQKATAEDETLQNVIQAIHLTDKKINMPKQYLAHRDELSVLDNVLLKGRRLVIPVSLRRDLLQKIHEGHLGIQKCKRRAREVLFWPSMMSDIAALVSSCHTCQSFQPASPKEPLLQEDMVKIPWHTVGVDLFSLDGRDYLALLDSYSSYPEVAKLRNTSSEHVCSKLQAIFSRFGIPTIIKTDNGPQFSCRYFKAFSEEFGFLHKTSSPKYPQGNGLAECGVKILKRLLKKASHSGEEPQVALLNYRATPLEGGKSPAELFFGRQIKTKLPQLNLTQYHSNRHLHTSYIAKKEEIRERQKRNYDKSAKNVQMLHTGDTVKIWTGQRWMNKAIVLRQVSDRSFEVKTNNGVILRRNRKHLLKIPNHCLDRTQSLDMDLLSNAEDSENDCPEIQHEQNVIDRDPIFGDESSFEDTDNAEGIHAPEHYTGGTLLQSSHGNQHTSSGRAVRRPHRLIEEC